MKQLTKQRCRDAISSLVLTFQPNHSFIYIRNTYIKKVIEKTESVIKRIRWTKIRTRRTATATMRTVTTSALRDNNQDFNIKWTIISRARPYSNISKRCDLCLTEKLMIITANPGRILNKRSELISKCRHENKFYLRNNWLKNNTLLVFSSHLIVIRTALPCFL